MIVVSVKSISAFCTRSIDRTRPQTVKRAKPVGISALANCLCATTAAEVRQLGN